MADINEQICKAVDIIVSKKIESIDFDSTIIVTTVDNQNRKNNQYVCSNGEAEFVAYSKDQSYKINESVQVTIPNNDYSQQKVIIGRYVIKDDKPFIFTQPFDTIIDVSGNIITGNKEPIVKSLLANEDYDINPIDEKTKKYSIKNQEILLWDIIFEEGYANFTRLGLQGQFRSWLSSLKPIAGSYGYKLEIFSDNGTTINNQLIKDWLKIYKNILNKISYTEDELFNLLEKTPDIWFENINNLSEFEQKITKIIFIEEMKNIDNRKDLIYALIYANVQVSEILLDSSEMYGNPYNFQSYLEQEKVYDISSLGKIFGCMLYFYEASGTFFNEKEDYIPYKTTYGQYFNPNLFTKDPYICFGYDLSGFTEEQAIIYTLDSDTYIIDDEIDRELNKIAIRLRWLHEFENGDIKVINENSNISGYDIRWYRFKLGAPSADEYSGVYWERVNQSYTIEENIPLDNINNLKTYYLLFHYLDDGTVADEYTYMANFCPKYTDYATVGPLQFNKFSHMSYWTDECLAKYNIDKSLAEHAFAGYRTSSITKFADQKWIDIFNQGFVYHDTGYKGSTYFKDYYTSLPFPVPSGCMHKIGFWEKLTLAYRLYWIYPEEFALLLEDNDIWRQGGIASTGKFNKYGDWINFKGKNPYTEMSYEQSNLYSDFESGINHFTEQNQTPAFRNLFALFADSFGEWTYIEDEYGMRDYVPADEGVRNYLYQCVEKFFMKMDNPTYLKVIKFDPFSYVLEPVVNVQNEQIKVIVLYDGKVVRSNILTFTNETEVASTATTELINGLSIWCEDKTYGNYYIYGQNNNLFDETKSNEILTLSAKFADISILSNTDKDIDVAEESPDLTEAKSIIWEFPLKYTMIIVHGFDYGFENKIQQAIKNNQGLINGINYTDCLIGKNIDTVKINEVDPEGKIYKLDGYFTDNEIIKVLGNTIYISRKGNKKDNTINNKQTYRINKTYNATNINNTIKCTVSKNSLNYTATKEMSFGLMGTNGTDATIVIDFEDNKSALTAGLANAETLKVIAHLYDFNHNEVDFNDSDLNLTCHWEWSQSLGTDKVIIEQRERYNPIEEKWELVDDTIIPNTCFLSYGPNLNINDDLFLILKATVSGFGDYDLITYKAIPIRASRNYRNLIGATEVLYSSTGHADYYKSPYELLYCADVNEYDMPQAEIIALNNINLKWSIYSPYKKSAEEDKFYGEISKGNILQPLLIYTKDADPYGVTCLDTNGNRLWIQPLVILQNEYPSATLNTWDGKSIEINYENGTIVAPAISAGKKNKKDNTFSGVMLGDWSSTDAAGDITQQTGVYGFHHGAMSYAFKEDGTAFIGKSGLGRILFDGNSGIITSSAWNLDAPAKSEGLFMDLDNGILKMQANRNYRQITSPNESDFSNYYISLEYQPVPLGAVYDSSKTYYIPTAYSANHRGNSTYIRYFYYKKEGEETYTKASSFDSNISGKYYFPIRFNAVNFNQAPPQEQLINYFTRLDFGYIKAQYNAESGTGLGLNYNSTDFQYYMAGEKGYITLSADENTYPLGIGTSSSITSRNFRVRWDGTCYITDGIFSGIVTADELYCDYGYIGGWEIDDTSLSGGKTVLDSYDGIFTNRIGIIDKISAANKDGLLGEIGLVEGADLNGNTTYNIGIVSKNQSIILNTLSATGNTSNIAFVSKGGTWAQCANFYVMGNTGGWKSKNQSIEFHTNKLVVSTPKPEDQTGIYARFAE